jgi:hypothetical protein
MSQHQTHPPRAYAINIAIQSSQDAASFMLPHAARLLADALLSRWWRETDSPPTHILIAKCVGRGVHMCRLKMSDLTKNRQNDAAEFRKIDLTSPSQLVMSNPKRLFGRPSLQLSRHPVVEHGDVGRLSSFPSRIEAKRKGR